VIVIFRRAAGAALALSLTLGGLMQPAPAGADSGSGAYLAGRQALYDSDFEEAALYYSRALVRDPSNPQLMESLTLSQLALGRADRALPVARQMESLGIRSQIAQMVIVANLIETENYEDMLARDPETQGVSPLVDGLLLAWSHMGTGAVSKALAQFDTVAEEKGLAGFALYHKAMALALVGDYEGAEAMFAEDDGKLTMISRRAALARVEIQSQLGRNSDALDVISSVFGGNLDPGLAEISDQLKADEKLPFTQVTSVRDGMAEVFFTIGAALKGEAADDYALIYSRMAGVLRPDHIDALLLSAELLDSLGQYELSVATYKQVPAGHPDHYAAELGRAEALRRAAKPDAAIEVLEQLAQDYPTLPSVHTALGDLQRQQEDYALAVSAYDRALEFSKPGAQSNWFVLYARGISHERLKQWEQAEADFRAALELYPDQPQVLNYLGYSMVEKQINLDEALDMIERAVAARPDSGYIVDSLGWVLYRLGRYDDAVSHMEKAVELMPVDPVVNDHLGDVFWAVGRMLEAEFQWKRALSFIDPDDTDGEADPDRIRRKLEVGLDAVLAEEGAPPLKVANGD
jgi:tetratricopeptide (TPR) repeat protein